MQNIAYFFPFFLYIGGTCPAFICKTHCIFFVKDMVCIFAKCGAFMNHILFVCDVMAAFKLPPVACISWRMGRALLV